MVGVLIWRPQDLFDVFMQQMRLSRPYAVAYGRLKHKLPERMGVWIWFGNCDCLRRAGLRQQSQFDPG